MFKRKERRFELLNTQFRFVIKRIGIYAPGMLPTGADQLIS